jgi:hypothetical protein
LTLIAIVNFFIHVEAQNFQLIVDIALIHAAVSFLAHLIPCVRAYQRLATSWVIAIPRLDWSSFDWLRRTQGSFALCLA